MRQEIVRIDDQRPPRGGGAGPFNPATGQGSIRPIPGDIVQNLSADGRTEIGSLNIWLTPHGFIKGALASGNAMVTSRGKKTVVSFTAFDKYTVTGTLDQRHLVERVATVIDGGFTGDTPLEAVYSDYADFDGVQLPRHIVQRQGGHPTLDIVVSSAEVNDAAALELRGGGPRGGGAVDAPGIKTEKIADGVWFLTLGAPQSLLIEFKDYVVVIEAPTGDARSMATIAAAKQMFADKPIRYLVNTHHHSDHAGGLRAYVAEGIPIITHESHKRYYEQAIFKNPHSLNPDRLARMPRTPIIEPMKDKRVLTDGSMTLELYLMRGNLHAEGLLMAYVPRAKLLIQADAFAPRPGAAPLPERSPFTTNLIDNVERLGLEVERVAHVHGGVDPWSKVLEVDGRAPTGR
jgi:glyoxylase-like metal-dependent hydrolase (beta-lactamase superfamily II)